jgi:hypothetical protein
VEVETEHLLIQQAAVVELEVLELLVLQVPVVMEVQE